MTNTIPPNLVSYQEMKNELVANLKSQPELLVSKAAHRPSLANTSDSKSAPQLLVARAAHKSSVGSSNIKTILTEV
jgi:hypothetical protein